MTPLPDTPPQDGIEITVPPDTDLGAMVDAILAWCHPLELDELGAVRDIDIYDAAARRLVVIADTAKRLAVALKEREGVMEEMATALEEQVRWGTHHPHLDGHEGSFDCDFCNRRARSRAALAKYEARRVS